MFCFFPGEIKCLMQQLLRAVAHLHDNWILHRDLKASNLLLSHKGILKVGDFGLAREYGSPLKCYTPIVVTLWYRSPELLLSAKVCHWLYLSNHMKQNRYFEVFQTIKKKMLNVFEKILVRIYFLFLNLYIFRKFKLFGHFVILKLKVLYGCTCSIFFEGLRFVCSSVWASSGSSQNKSSFSLNYF